MAVITISRPYGSGGTLFAKDLAEKLGYIYVDKSYCSIVGDEVKHCLEYFGEEEEVAPDLIDRMRSLMSNKNFYKLNLQATIYSLAMKDNVLFVGRGANIILEGVPNVISIQITGKLEDRIKALAEVKNISYEDALKRIEKMDNEKKKFIEYYFDRDIFDPTLYHFIINLSLVPIKHAVETMESYVRNYFSKSDFEKSQKILINRLVEKRAEIMLFGLGITQNAKVNFTMKEDGTLTVKGVLSSENEKQKLLKALKHIEEVKKVEDNLKVGILSRMIY